VENKNIEDRMERLEASMREVSAGYEQLISKIDALTQKVGFSAGKVSSTPARETAARKFAAIPDCKYYDLPRLMVETRHG
jgi:hypothetical protein